MEGYVLEVQKFYTDINDLNPEWRGKFEHQGYMNRLFKTK